MAPAALMCAIVALRVQVAKQQGAELGPQFYSLNGFTVAKTIMYAPPGPVACNGTATTTCFDSIYGPT